MKKTNWLRNATLGLLALGVGSCALLPRANFLSPETKTQVDGEFNAEQTVAEGGTGVQGISVSGTDTIALWLAIISLALAPYLGAKTYEKVLRPRRLKREANGNYT